MLCGGWSTASARGALATSGLVCRSRLVLPRNGVRRLAVNRLATEKGISRVRLQTVTSGNHNALYGLLVA